MDFCNRHQEEAPAQVWRRIWRIRAKPPFTRQPMNLATAPAARRRRVQALPVAVWAAQRPHALRLLLPAWPRHGPSMAPESLSLCPQVPVASLPCCAMVAPRRVLAAAPAAYARAAFALVVAGRSRSRASSPGSPRGGIPAGCSTHALAAGLAAPTALGYAPAGPCGLATGYLATHAHQPAARARSRIPGPQTASRQPAYGLRVLRAGARALTVKCQDVVYARW